MYMCIYWPIYVYMYMYNSIHFDVCTFLRSGLFHIVVTTFDPVYMYTCTSMYMYSLMALCIADYVHLYPCVTFINLPAKSHHIVFFLDRVFSYSEGGYFKAHLLFPKEYPQRPPKMKFITDIWHPNGKALTNTPLLIHVIFV